jgi:LPXTG-site transpeptidase (sortase) family protein
MALRRANGPTDEQGPSRVGAGDGRMTTEISKSRKRTQRVLCTTERLLFGFGLVCLAVYGSACAERTFFQSFAAQDFDRELEQVLRDEVHDQHEWSVERVARFDATRVDEVQALGRLEVPSAGVSVMVLEGTDDDTLNRAVGHIEGTALPDEDGNLGIAGHRDSFFRGLRHVEKGDRISLATHQGLARYEVTEISIVRPSDIEVLDPTDQAAITLVTCYPFYFVGKAPKRYVVRADRVEFEPWTRDLLDRYAARPTELARSD